MAFTYVPAGRKLCKTPQNSDGAQLTIIRRVDERLDDVDERRLAWTAGELADVSHKIVHARWTSIQEVRRQLNVVVEQLQLSTKVSEAESAGGWFWDSPVHYHSTLAHPVRPCSRAAADVSTIASEHRFPMSSELSPARRRHNF